MSLVLPVDATDEVGAAGFCTLFAAEFAGLSRGLSLEGEAAVRGDDEYGAAARTLDGMLERGCVEKLLPAEMLLLVLARRPCTSLSALQARWNKRVMLVYSL
jgi:hypothetical protein